MEEVMHVLGQGLYEKSVYCEPKIAFKDSLLGTSLAVQWLTLCAANAGGTGNNPYYLQTRSASGPCCKLFFTSQVQIY